MEAEHRKLTRRHLLYYLPIVDASTGAPLGRLGDLSREGLLLLAPTKWDEGTKLAMEIQIPAHLGLQQQSLKVNIVIRWCKQEGPRSIYAHGCRMDAVNEEDRRLIDQLIQRIGFSDGTKKIMLKNDRNIFADGEA